MKYKLVSRLAELEKAAPDVESERLAALRVKLGGEAYREAVVSMYLLQTGQAYGYTPEELAEIEPTYRREATRVEALISKQGRRTTDDRGFINVAVPQ